MTKIIQEYVTTDIILASTLRAYDIKLDQIRIVDKKRGAFYFVDVPEDLLLQYDSQQLKVEPIAFNQMRISLSVAIKRLQN
jgi:hypothetical protein